MRQRARSLSSNCSARKSPRCRLRDRHNLVTLNTTVGNIVNGIRRVVPDVDVKLVDARVMNQLSCNVANERFRALGFAFTGDLEKDIEATINMLRNSRPAS